jgi:hypothetical protein
MKQCNCLISPSGSNGTHEAVHCLTSPSDSRWDTALPLLACVSTGAIQRDAASRTYAHAAWLEVTTKHIDAMLEAANVDLSYRDVIRYAVHAYVIYSSCHGTSTVYCTALYYTLNRLFALLSCALLCFPVLSSALLWVPLSPLPISTLWTNVRL